MRKRKILYIICCFGLLFYSFLPMIETAVADHRYNSATEEILNNYAMIKEKYMNENFDFEGYKTELFKNYQERYQQSIDNSQYIIEDVVVQLINLYKTNNFTNTVIFLNEAPQSVKDLVFKQSKNILQIGILVRYQDLNYDIYIEADAQATKHDEILGNLISAYNLVSLLDQVDQQFTNIKSIYLENDTSDTYSIYYEVNHQTQFSHYDYLTDIYGVLNSNLQDRYEDIVRYADNASPEEYKENLILNMPIINTCDELSTNYLTYTYLYELDINKTDAQTDIEKLRTAMFYGGRNIFNLDSLAYPSTCRKSAYIEIE